MRCRATRLVGWGSLLVAVGLCATGAPANPYADIDWDAIERHRANVHTHTTESDGLLTPAEAILAYRERGYTVLALTDHNTVTWPWEAFEVDGLRAAEARRRAFRARGRRVLTGPNALGMLAVPGAEPSRHHHLGSYFCEVPGGETVEQTLAEVRRQSGLAVVFHPGRYAWSDDRYVALFRVWDELVGVEVYNQGDRYPGDRALWDRLLTRLMPERPVWGWSNDDMHARRHLARNWTVFLLPELTEAALRDAMRHGRFFFSRVRADGDTAPEIRAVRMDTEAQSVTIEAEGHARTVWISEGREVHEGDRIAWQEVEGARRYLRARLIGEDGRGWTYTQPIALPLR